MAGRSRSQQKQVGTGDAFTRSSWGESSDAEIKRLHLATRFMTVFQQGLLTLKKLRQGGRQQITVQYLNVSQGSQAVMGDVERNKR